MKEIESRLISASGPRIRMRVTWRLGWFDRWLSGVDRVSSIYEGSGTVWHVVPSFKRCATSMESKLADIATRLTSTVTGDT